MSQDVPEVPLRFVVLLSILISCGSAPSGYTVQLRFATPELRTAAVAVEVHAVERCGPFAEMAQTPENVLASGVIGQGPSEMALGLVPPGRIGLYAIARDARCRVIAAGCQESTVALSTLGTVGVVLSRVIGPECPNTMLCDRGFCGLMDNTGVCAAGTADCDRGLANRCEVSITSDAANCGGCGQRCGGQNGAGVCTLGVCSTRCDPGRGDCDNNQDNGCETSLTTDRAHCGSCSVACRDVDNATPTCAMGLCGFACDATSADCDGAAANGCETDTRSSARNCGRCGEVCMFPNANAQCSEGVCGVDGCVAGFSNCDGEANNGCETPGTCP